MIMAIKRMKYNKEAAVETRSYTGGSDDDKNKPKLHWLHSL